MDAGKAKAPLLLIKMPTRNRPEKFFAMLDKYYAHLSGLIPYHFVISCDEDDATMNNETVIKRCGKYEHLTLDFDDNSCKVDAYNAGINDFDFDILLVASDDMEPIEYGFDKIIADKMHDNFPDYDGVLNFNDGNVGAALNTHAVMGKKYFDRFEYIYYPTYKSVFRNEEFTLVSKMLGKEKVFDTILFMHRHPLLGTAHWDDLYQRSEENKEIDRFLFDERRSEKFHVDEQMIKEALPKKWSILICTLQERKASFEKLHTKLILQIESLNLHNEIEIIYFSDNREHSVGHKRNSLLEQSRGEYVCFVDDDDDVHEKYIEMIYERLLKDPDCVSLVGVMTHHGKYPRTFLHSRYYKNYFQVDDVYYRPPNHLNPMKRSIAIQVAFPENSHGEDYDWTNKLAGLELIKTEEALEEPYYFYHVSDDPRRKYY